MNRIANIALLVAVALVAVVAERLFFSTPQLVEELPASASLEGKIISVEAVSPDQARLRRALVKLRTGEIVRASVPGSCLVFPGQVASLARYGEGSGITFMVKGHGRDDS